MNPAVKWGIVGFLAVVAGAYFAFIAWKAAPLARVLLARGWKERGWSETGLSLMLRALGILGLLIALAGIAIVVTRLRG